MITISKHITLLSLFLCSFFTTSAQNSPNNLSENTSISANINGQEKCVKERWLILYKDDNSFLYQNEKGTIDPYQEIKNLLLTGKIRLWNEHNNNPELLTSPLPSMIHDSVPYLDDSLFYNIYFDYRSKGYEPLKTIHGEDSLFPYPDGSYVVLYPLPKYEPLTFDKISEFRIKEILIFDSITKKEILKPSLIGFDIFAGSHTVLFWVKIDDLKNHITINKNWVDFLVKKKYNGFIQKQYACKDPTYQWKKVDH